MQSNLCVRLVNKSSSSPAAAMAAAPSGYEFVPLVLDALKAGTAVPLDVFKEHAIRLINAQRMPLNTFTDLFWQFNVLPKENRPGRVSAAKIHKTAREIFQRYEKVDVTDLPPARIYAAFYNNSPTPGAGVSVAAAVDFCGGAELVAPDGSLTERGAEKILACTEDWGFDYVDGRRMKLWLGTRSKPRTELCMESYDKCWQYGDRRDLQLGYMGKGRDLIEYVRKTGRSDTFCLNLEAVQFQETLRGVAKALEREQQQGIN